MINRGTGDEEEQEGGKIPNLTPDLILDQIPDLPLDQTKDLMWPGSPILVSKVAMNPSNIVSLIFGSWTV